MNKRKVNDLSFGTKCEKLFLSKFKYIIKKSDNEMDEIDFKHNTKNILYELKSRKYDFEDCNDWKVSMNKLIYHQNNNKNGKFYVYMMFHNGLYYWKYDEKQVHKKDCEWAVRVDRGKVERNFYFNIKRELFKKSKYNLCSPKDMTNVKHITKCLID
mgnify:CR=1 FL=1